MKLTGDPEGIEALKAIKQERPDFLKFLISEVQTNTTRSAEFKTNDGVAYVIRLVVATGELKVDRKG